MKLFHVSETPNIELFTPRPSPSFFEAITADVVFAIAEPLLHNYLLPRDCPRVTFYVKSDTSDKDKARFFGSSSAKFIVAIEKKWYPVIKQTTLYCYEFSSEGFIPLDEGAGYYINYNPVMPVAVHKIDDILAALLKRDLELRIMPGLLELAAEVAKSSLQFSCIRMRNAGGNEE